MNRAATLTCFCVMLHCLGILACAAAGTADSAKANSESEAATREETGQLDSSEDTTPLFDVKEVRISLT